MAFIKEYPVRTSAHTQFVKIDHLVQQAVQESGVSDGVCTVFVPHTTAAVTINENADPDVVRDMIFEIDKIIPWNDNYQHAEGNSAAHIKSSFFGVTETVWVQNGRLLLGTWQSLYFCEFDGPRSRKIMVRIA
jgi:secondary thiamine-phosphate synthase enzyme